LADNTSTRDSDIYGHRRSSCLSFCLRATTKAIPATTKRPIPIQRVMGLPMPISTKPAPNATQKTTQGVETPRKYSSMPNPIRPNPPLRAIFIKGHYTIDQPRLYLTVYSLATGYIVIGNDSPLSSHFQGWFESGRFT
jgi:hypothetical protein